MMFIKALCALHGVQRALNSMENTKSFNEHHVLCCNNLLSVAFESFSIAYLLICSMLHSQC